MLRVIEVTSRVSNVTIRNGNGVGLDSGRGGGIFIHSGALLLQNSTVSGNTGTTGAGIAASGIAQLNGVTVSGNPPAPADSRAAAGSSPSIGSLLLRNSTVSGNSAVDEVGAASQGGGVHSSGTLAIIASTIASNSAGEGGGLYAVAPATGAAQPAELADLARHGRRLRRPGGRQPLRHRQRDQRRHLPVQGPEQPAERQPADRLAGQQRRAH